MGHHSPQSLSDEFIRSNPVLAIDDWIRCYFDWRNSDQSRSALTECLRRWCDAGVDVPEHAVADLVSRNRLDNGAIRGSQAEPRVVGLVVDDQRGYVTALLPGAAEHSRLLPFTPTQIQSLLVRLCDCLTPEPVGLPERVLLNFKESLKRDALGNSMTIAGLLAAVDWLSKQSVKLLSRSCAVVETAEDNALIPVGQVKAKLEAFRREYQRGTLLVRSSRCTESEPFKEHFDEVWSVASIDDLAGHIKQQPSLVAALTTCRPIGSTEVATLMSYIQRLDLQRQNLHVVRSCERIAGCGFDETVAHYDRMRILKHRADALRHLGRNLESLAVCENLANERAQLPHTVISDEELLTQSVDRAAALIDTCDYLRAQTELQDWLSKAKSDPQRFTAGSRVQLFNTVGRILILIEEPGWQELFDCSLHLQRHTDRANISRTQCYRVHGLLRTNQAAATRILINELKACSGKDILHNGFLEFFETELDRRDGQLSSLAAQDVNFECYPRAFAFFAAARQKGRDVNDAVALCDHSERILSAHIEQGIDQSELQESKNLLNLVHAAVRLTRAGLQTADSEWSKAVLDIRLHLQGLPNSAQEWFADSLEALGSGPNMSNCERVISRLPYL